MHYQRGIPREQTALLPARVEDYVADDHPVRVIDAFVERLDVAELGFAHARLGATGRPPYHPRDLLKLYIWGYLNRVRSTRGLEREAGRNLEVLWLLRSLRPDFKTLSSFRKANAAAISKVCREFVQFCRGLGLFGGMLVAIDGTKLQAVASTKAVWTPERLAAAQAKLVASAQRYLDELAESEASDVGDDDRERVQQALAALADRAGELGRIAPELEAKRQHVATEPDAKRMRVAGKGSPVAYNVQSAVDSKHGLIAAHAVTDASNDRQQLLPTALLAKEALGADALDVIADAGYHNGEQAQRCEENGIVPAVPMQLSDKDNALFSKSRFEYQRENDAYRCPAGELLRRYKTDRKHGTAYYRTKACGTCPLKPQCTDARWRTISRERHADAAEKAAARFTAEHAKQRRSLVEHPFGTIKFLMPRFLLRGLDGARAETSLAVMAFNFKRAVSLVGVAALLADLQLA